MISIEFYMATVFGLIIVSGVLGMKFFGRIKEVFSDQVAALVDQNKDLRKQLRDTTSQATYLQELVDKQHDAWHQIEQHKQYLSDIEGYLFSVIRLSGRVLKDGAVDMSRELQVSGIHTEHLTSLQGAINAIGKDPRVQQHIISKLETGGDDAQSETVGS